jgi:uncharacterized DUF497 family protein
VRRDEPEAFEWDHAKSERNEEVRGFDFEFASRVVWTPRARARRIISAWPASRQERRIYHDYREKE